MKDKTFFFIKIVGQSRDFELFDTAILKQQRTNGRVESTLLLGYVRNLHYRVDISSVQVSTRFDSMLRVVESKYKSSINQRVLALAFSQHDWISQIGFEAFEITQSYRVELVFEENEPVHGLQVEACAKMKLIKRNLSRLR